MEADFCVQALNEAVARYGAPPDMVYFDTLPALQAAA
jgi:hypothetical protein